MGEGSSPRVLKKSPRDALSNGPPLSAPSAPAANGIDGASGLPTTLPPPYTDSDLVLALRDGEVYASSFDYQFTGTPCALACIIVVAQILLLEKNTYRGSNLLNGIHHPRFRKAILDVFNAQVAAAHLGVDKLHQLPSYKRSLDLLSSEDQKYSYKSFYGLFLRMRDNARTSDYSVAAILTRASERVAIVCIPTGGEFPEYPEIFAVFSLHARPAGRRQGPAVMFIPTATHTATLVAELLDSAESSRNHPESQHEPSFLTRYTAYVFAASIAATEERTPARAPVGGEAQFIDVQVSTPTVSPTSKPIPQGPDYTQFVYSIRHSIGVPNPGVELVKHGDTKVLQVSQAHPLIEARAQTREREQAAYLASLRSSLLDPFADPDGSLAQPNSASTSKGKGRMPENAAISPGADRKPLHHRKTHTGLNGEGSRLPAITLIDVGGGTKGPTQGTTPYANIVNRRHSAYAGTFPNTMGQQAVMPSGIAGRNSLNLSERRAAPRGAVTPWDAAIDPTLVPVLVESENPTEAQQLRVLEDRFARRHREPTRLRRPPPPPPQPIFTEPLHPPEPVVTLENVSSPTSPGGDSVATRLLRRMSTRFRSSPSPSSSRPTSMADIPSFPQPEEEPETQLAGRKSTLRKRMVVPAAIAEETVLAPDLTPEFVPPPTTNPSRSRKPTLKKTLPPPLSAAGNDPELAAILKQIQEQDEREQEELSIALAMSLSVENQPTPDPKPVARTSSVPAPAPARFASIYEDDDIPFMSHNLRMAPVGPHHTRSAPPIASGSRGPQQSYGRFYDRDVERNYHSAFEAQRLQDEIAANDRAFALSLQEEETRNASLIDALAQQQHFDCVMCMEKNPMDDVAIVDGCGHKFCRSCLRQYLTTKLGEGNFPIPCPTCSASKNTRNPGEISSFLAQQLGITERQFEMWNKFDLARFSVEIRCPHCKQTSLVDREEFQASPLGVCPLPNCRREWCKKCSLVVDPNAGPHSCDGQQEMERYIAATRIRRCPGCNTPIERTAGCDHMTCRVPGCGTHFSYSTGRRMNR